MLQCVSGWILCVECTCGIFLCTYSTCMCVDGCTVGLLGCYVSCLKDLCVPMYTKNILLLTYPYSFRCPDPHGSDSPQVER